VDIELQTATDPETGEVLSSAVALDNRAADYRFTDLDDRVEVTLEIHVGDLFAFLD
jgi:hypothetical protein